MKMSIDERGGEREGLGRFVLHISDSGPSLVKSVFQSRNWEVQDPDLQKHCRDPFTGSRRSSIATAKGGSQYGYPSSYAKQRGSEKSKPKPKDNQKQKQKLCRSRGTDAALRLCWRSSRYKKSEYSLADRDVLLNHYKDSGMVTRKDKLMRALRKMRGIHGSFLYDFFPSGYILPTEYTKFVKEFSENSDADRGNLWICKPSDLSRGRKIFLLESLHDLKYDQQYIIQNYIANPLTIGGYKVDLRVYVLMTSIHPLRIWIYKDGLARFGTEKYAGSDISNLFAHLTNTSINKNSETYNTDKDVIGSGSKWDFPTFSEWLDTNTTNTANRFSDIWQEITHIVLLTMLSLVTNKDADTKGGCFELFGFDILLDCNLKPWLIEVNCAPSMGVSCPADTRVKSSLIHHMIDVLQNVPSPKLEPQQQLKLKQVNQARHARSSSFSMDSGVSVCDQKQSLRQMDRQRRHSTEYAGSSEGFQRLTQRVGGFELAFPFNETTHSLSLKLARSVQKEGVDIAPLTRLIVQAVKRRKQVHARARDNERGTQ